MTSLLNSTTIASSTTPLPQPPQQQQQHQHQQQKQHQQHHQQQSKDNSNENDNNEFDNLLDIFSADMDFEQAFSMYNDLQQKNAIGSFEELSKVQMLNSQYTSNLSTNTNQSQYQPHHNQVYHHHTQQPLHQQQHPLSQHLSDDEFARSRQQILNGGIPPASDLPSPPLPNSSSSIHAHNQYHSHHQEQQQQQQQLHQSHLLRSLHVQTALGTSDYIHSGQDAMQEDAIEEEDDFDQFFTTTESNALEKFLDNLANPNSSGDPLQFYNSTNNPLNGNGSGHLHHRKPLDLEFNFEMHTMKVPSHLRSQNSPNNNSNNNNINTTNNNIATSPKYMLLQQQQIHPQFMENNSNNHIHLQQFQQQHPQQHQQQQQQHYVPPLMSQQFDQPLQQQNNDIHFHSTIQPQSLPSPPSSDYKHNPVNLKRELTEAFAPSVGESSLPNSINTATLSKTSLKQLITPPTSGDEGKKQGNENENENKNKNGEKENLLRKEADAADDAEEEGEDAVDGSSEESSRYSTSLDKSESVNSRSSSKSSSPNQNGEEPQKKRRRSSNKPLLSLEQKRQNHSYSEQKRRQLCKIAYQRCLERIIDLEAFSKLPEMDEAERKSKRARVNKEGLPNLSKHSALVRISNEMETIIGLNNQLKKLLNM